MAGCGKLTKQLAMIATGLLAHCCSAQSPHSQALQLAHLTPISSFEAHAKQGLSSLAESTIQPASAPAACGTCTPTASAGGLACFVRTCISLRQAACADTLMQHVN